MPAAIDTVFVLLFALVLTAAEHYFFWPRMSASIKRGDPGARMRGYRRIIIGEWLFTLAAIVIWTSFKRPVAPLHLAPPSGWRLGLAVGLVLVMAVLSVLQLRAIARLPRERLNRVRAKFSSVSAILPHTRREHLTFLAVSATAGICEEFLYRGYLAWFLSAWMSRPLAMLVVVIVFGLGHSYQGVAGAMKATLAGAVMAGIVLATGSLIPAMIVHALVDAHSGTVAWIVLREPAPGGDVPSDAGLMPATAV